MSTLRGIFAEPKKEPKKNFIKENVKQLKMQEKANRDRKPISKSRFGDSNSQPLRSDSLGPVKSTPSTKSGKVSLSVPGGAKKLNTDIKIKKGDIAEFLRRRARVAKARAEESSDEEPSPKDSGGQSGPLRDIGCQTIESNLPQKFEESTKITTLYTKKDEDEEKKASGDSERYRSQSPRRAIEEMADYERPHSRLNAILERKHEQKNKDPYLPTGYQKGVLPKYLRERKETGVKEAEGVKADDGTAVCPPGHVTLPDNERKETLRMLRNSFAELVSELNKMPVKSDTLKMRNRKMELEKQLAKLEEGIKVFSRPKVFVKIGE